MTPIKSEIHILQSRGYVTEEQISSLRSANYAQLLALLQSPAPTERTIAARLLVHCSSKAVALKLIEALQVETKLYSKIAMTETLAKIGAPALPLLIPLLGRVGTNQHRKLPDKPFKKKSYPLPRDIIARTLIKMGAVAFDALQEVLKSGPREQVLEALDALGHTAFKKLETPHPTAVTDCLQRFGNDDLMRWKVYRTLQSFPTREALQILQNAVNCEQELALVGEAKRSLSQIQESLV